MAAVEGERDLSTAKRRCDETKSGKTQSGGPRDSECGHALEGLCPSTKPDSVAHRPLSESLFFLPSFLPSLSLSSTHRQPQPWPPSRESFDLE